MTDYPLISALVGGMLIGLSAVLLLWFNGRLAGISGIFYGGFSLRSRDRHWRLMFVIGLIFGGFLYSLLFATPLTTRNDFPLPLIIVAGLLVGFGTRMGSGCTSGHGICGVSRLSAQSILSTVTFVATGMLSASILSKLIGFSS